MSSVEGEWVDFHQNIYLEGPVEVSFPYNDMGAHFGRMLNLQLKVFDHPCVSLNGTFLNLSQ